VKISAILLNYATLNYATFECDFMGKIFKICTFSTS
jgi:hypothetical protein